MVWRCHGILCDNFHCLLFRVWANSKKRNLNKSEYQGSFSTITRHIYKSILKDTLQSVKDFTNMDQDTCKVFTQDLSKHHKTKIDKGARKIISCTKIWNFSLFFSQTNLDFKFNSVFIDIWHNDYWYSTDYEVHPVHLSASSASKRIQCSLF